ncbi:hypothetical protein [Nocardia sp. NBC_01009]|uniref:hypothetical protein n=1 Tax=Nocardia sp. NBC_01009 TaxID=2975996 RepID=UPI003863DC20
MLTDSTHIQILWALVDAELSVNDLADHVGEPSTVGVSTYWTRFTTPNMPDWAFPDISPGCWYACIAVEPTRNRKGTGI